MYVGTHMNVCMVTLITIRSESDYRVNEATINVHKAKKRVISV